MNAEDNKRLHRAWVEEILERKDDTGLERWFSGAHQLHQTLVPEIGRGPDGVLAALRHLRRVMDPLSVLIVDQIADDRRVATRVDITGRHIGPIGAMKATGGWKQVQGMMLSRIVRGVAYETWIEIDAYRLMQILKAAKPREGMFASRKEDPDA